MTEVPLEQLIDKVGSVYKLVVLASRRALELNGGAPPLIDVKSDKTPAIALEEIALGKVTYSSPDEEKKTKKKEE